MPPEHRFALNCLLTQHGSDLSRISFKRLTLSSSPHYGVLRSRLRGSSVIWYGEANCIYFLGDEAPLLAALNIPEIDSDALDSVDYKHLWSHREPVLRSLIYDAIDRVMRERGFLPSIGAQHHDYYPSFDTRNGVRISDQLSWKGMEVRAKNGLSLHLDLSPRGPVLLWIDIKLFTFVRFMGRFRQGEPIYLLCNKLDECLSGDYQLLVEGAFVSSLEEDDVSTLPCILNKVNPTLLVQTKVQHQLIRVPQACAYTTVDVPTLKTLGLYDWWRPRAIPSSTDRHKLTLQLLHMIAQQENALTVPFLDGQNVSFNLDPVTLRVPMRFA